MMAAVDGAAAAAAAASAAEGASEKKTARSVHHTEMDPNEFPQLLQQYYLRLFPYAKYYKWLSYGGTDKKVFQHREFSFTLKGDVYVRYQSFANQAEMQAAIQERCPEKIDIGAVFTAPPKDHKKIKAAQFYPVEKELVFDIDMTDYDDIRSCCSGAAICHKCWPYMTVALKVLDTALREDFGFRHLLWVYSGRRGIHCWVCDKRARALSQDGRSAVAEYLQLLQGGDNAARKVNLGTPLFPAVERALAIVKPYFEQTVLSGDAQNLFKTPEQQKKLLSILGNEQLEKDLETAWEGAGLSSQEKWTDLCEQLKKQAKKATTLNGRRNEIILQYTYPRLDINVSKGLNHLLKSPFVVHPKTGRVCVPIDPKEAESFDPFLVPTIKDLLREIDEYDKLHAAEEDGKKVRDSMKTSLVKALAVFEKFLQGVMEDNAAEGAAPMDEGLDW